MILVYLAAIILFLVLFIFGIVMIKETKTA